MKKLLMTMVMAIMAFGAQAQNDAISKYFSKYEKDTDKFSAVSISGKMFAMINSIQVEDDEDKALVESLGKIKGVKVLFAQKDVDGVAMYKEAMGAIKGRDFEELMSVRDEDKDIKFYIKEKGNKIDELFMVMGGMKEFGMVSIVGDGIDINQLYKLSKSLGMDEFKHLGGN
tara:strand:- start:2356 stop:2871 length:516 start_codon:yes stop_codon:yes gene_type:complete